jgi:hypothetical protein
VQSPQRPSLGQRFAVVRDAFVDVLTGRGGPNDRTQRLQGQGVLITHAQALAYYEASGLIQNAVDRPAEAAVREWHTIKMPEGHEELGRLLQNRTDELEFRGSKHGGDGKLLELLKFSRINQNGSLIFAGVSGNESLGQGDKHLENEIESGARVEFLNVIQDIDQAAIDVPNNNQYFRKNYNKPRIRIAAIEPHESRYRWLVSGFSGRTMRGISVIQNVLDGVRALDSSLNSAARVVQALSLNIFSSDELAGLTPEKRYEFLLLFKNTIETEGTIALAKDETFQRLMFSVTGLREIFDYMQEFVAGLGRIPKSVIFGKSFGVVSAGEFDLISFAAEVRSSIQETRVRPVCEWLYNLLLREKEGTIAEYLRANKLTPEIDYEIKFPPIFRLDPDSESKVRLTNAQADQLDTAMGKADAQEARNLDPRYDELETEDNDLFGDLDFAAKELERQKAELERLRVSGQD